MRVKERQLRLLRLLHLGGATLSGDRFNWAAVSAARAALRARTGTAPPGTLWGLAPCDRIAA